MANRPGVINLALGEPDFDTPPHISAAVQEALRIGLTHYGPNLGAIELRQAIATRMAQVSGLEVGPAEIIVTLGGQEALFLAMAAVLNPGDELLIPDPGYPVYNSQAIGLGLSPKGYGLRPDAGFAPDWADLESLVTPRTRAIVVNSPGNPTGQLLSRETLLTLAAFAERHDLTVISDEVYETIVYDGMSGVCFATLPGMKSRTIVVNSFSKAYAMTGWRLGYAVADQALIQGMVKLHQAVVSSAPTMLQFAATVALQSDQSFCVSMTREYQARRDLITGLLNRVPGFRCANPRGAFYAFPDIRATGMDSMALCEFLIAEAGVACVPGITFGARGEGFLRISYATSREKLMEAGERMARALS
jgi:aspartate/methionine/tyrosine aminotransferase